MEGFINRDEDSLYIGVSNLKQFNELLKQAEEEADRLQKTLSKLRYYNLKFDFVFNDNVISSE